MILYWFFCFLLHFTSAVTQDCSKQDIGLRAKDGVPYYYFQATSYNVISFEYTKQNGDLNKDDKAWCPRQDLKNGRYLEVDLGSQYSLCGVSSEGIQQGYVTKFTLKMSLDRITWKSYVDNSGIVQEFVSDNENVTMHNFTSRHNARFIRFYPIESVKEACMLVELYGTKVETESCEKTNLPDIRKNHSQTTCLENNGSNYFEFHTSANSVVCAIKVVDDSGYSKTDTDSYSLQFSNDGNDWSWYEELNLTKNFTKNDYQILYERVLCKYLRIIPARNTSCLRILVYGYPHKIILTHDIGLKYGKTRTFLDESFVTNNVKAPEARLYIPHSSLVTDNGFLEVSMARKYLIFGLSLQGFWYTNNKFYFLNQVSVFYSLDYINWLNYGEQVVILNNKENVVETIALKRPLEARFMRFHVNADAANPTSAMRIELHGISSQLSEACTNPFLDMNTDKYRSFGKTNSDRIYPPGSSVLGDDSSAWLASSTKFLTFMFIKPVSISGIITKGFVKNSLIKGRVKHFKITYDYGKIPMEINQTYVQNPKSLIEKFPTWFDIPIVAKSLRLTVIKADNEPYLKIGFFGCATDFLGPIVNMEPPDRILKRNSNMTIHLQCVVRGQRGFTVRWYRNNQEITNSSNEIIFARHQTYTGIHETIHSHLTINYTSEQDDKNIFQNFNCTGKGNNKRVLNCYSFYTCSARYPDAEPSTQSMAVTAVPNFVLPAPPQNVKITDLNSTSVTLSWMAAQDHEESRLTAYVIKIRNKTLRKGLTTFTNLSFLTITIGNLSEFTEYNIKVAAESIVATSQFSSESEFITFLPANVTLDHLGEHLLLNASQQNVSITCVGVSYPKPKVTWFKDGEEVTFSQRFKLNESSVYQVVEVSEADKDTNLTIEVKSTLYIRPTGASLKDHGNYTCQVLNANESSIPRSETVEVIFPPVFVETPTNQISQEEANVSLTCRAKAAPSAIITWNITAIKMNISWTTVNNDTELVIFNIQSHGGYHIYVTCQAHNKGGAVTTDSFIEIKVKPRIVGPTTSEPLLYNDVTLNCQVFSNPAAQVWWLKDGEHINDTNIVLENDNKTLVIKSSMLYHEGNYTCYAKSNLSSTSATTALRLKALPRALIIEGQVRRFTRGQKGVFIECIGYGYPLSKVSWIYNVLKGNSTSNGTFQKTDQNFSRPGNRTGLNYDSNLNYVKSILFFNPIGASFSDYGNYTCLVEVNTDKNMSTVAVLFYPVIETGPTNQLVLEGQNAIFDCIIDGQPQPTTSWLFRGSNIINDHRILPNGSLVMYAVNNTDLYEGVYSCIANNEAGQSTEANATLTIHVPAKVISLQKQRNNAILECSILGDPFPVIKWLRSGIEGYLGPPKYVLGDKNRTMAITNVTASDYGNYTCIVENQYSKDNKTLTVTVDVPPRVSLNSSALHPLESFEETAMIECNVKAYPRTTVSWYKNGVQVMENGSDVFQKYETISGYLKPFKSILYVSPAKSKEQFGLYTCRTPTNETTSVEIVLLPIINATSNKTVLVGENVTLTCSANSYPDSLVYWKKRNGSTYTTFGNQSVLRLTNVSDDEEGTYLCFAKNKGGNKTVTVSLTVHAIPRINVKLNDTLRYRNGSRVQLDCSASGDPYPTYTWTKDGDPNIPNSMVVNDSTLVINPVVFQSQGIYACVVKNVEGNDTTMTNLTVYEPTRKIIGPKDKTVNETDDVIFTCTGAGIPTPTVLWKRNNMTIINSDRINIATRSLTSDQNYIISTLEIENVRFTDRGNYSCVLQNSFSKDEAGAVFDVYVAPVANITQPETISAKIQESVQFTCLVYGYPEPVINWKKDDEVLQTTSRYAVLEKSPGTNELEHVSYLRIKNSSRNDTGNYSCSLQNAAGRDVDRVSLTILEKPDEIQVNISKIQKRSVSLHWEVPFDGNSPIFNFTLVYFVNGSQPVVTISKVYSSDERNATITGLTPGKVYVFYFLASNKIGSSTTAVNYAETLEDVPSPPQNVTLSSEASSITVRWSSPKHENGKITSYEVVYWEIDSNHLINKSLAGQNRLFVISGLKPFTNYIVKVRAYTSAGAGNFTSPKIIRTKESTPSKPRNFTAQTISNTTVRLSWAPPDEKNGIIRNYEIRYSATSDSGAWKKSNVSGNETSTEIRNLRPFTTYVFKVRAYTTAGGGNSSENDTATTEEGVPSAPLDVSSVVLSNTSIRIWWASPLMPNGKISGYCVLYRSKQAESSRCNNTTELIIDKLVPFTLYKFQIQAFTSAGGGNLSEVIKNTTMEGVPTKPRNVELTDSTVDSLSLTWEKPSPEYGVVVKYSVIYWPWNEDQETEVLSQETSNERYTLEGLKSFTTYSISIKAYTSVGPGPTSEVFSAATEIDLEKPPESYEPDKMIAVSLPRPSNYSEFKFYRVIAVIIPDDEKTKDVDSYKNTELLSYDEVMELSKEERYGKPYVAMAFKGDKFEANQAFILGEGNEFDNNYPENSRRKRADEEYRNGPLSQGVNYCIFVRGYTSKTTFVSSKPLTRTTGEKELVPRKDKSSDVLVIVVVVLAVLVVTALVVVAAVFKFRKKKTTAKPGDGSSNLGHAIPIHELPSYIKEANFQNEFQDIPKIIRDHSQATATLEANIGKNRYKNIIPYDYTRVHLSLINGQRDTDYINASFIQGFKKPSKYIATQGPLPETAKDFWRMVWEQECYVIVMLTGLEENGKVKCYGYWPVGDEWVTYGVITVQQTGQAVLANYTVRFFTIKEISSHETRTIQQLHFTAWPDHGVPRYPGPLLHFYNRYRQELKGTGPVIVHCSAGCGRTGTFIGMDYILHKLKDDPMENETIDLRRFVREMRGQRVLMVQTEVQYEFLHHIINESVAFGHYEIQASRIGLKASALREINANTGKTKAKEEYQAIKVSIHKELAFTGNLPENIEKNRSSVVPYNYNRVVLGGSDQKNDYINASFISGYLYEKNFIATQSPLPVTMNDFWQMIHEQKCAVIVALTTIEEQKQFGQYWPEEGFKSFAAINVQLEEVNNDFVEYGFVVRKFKLTKKLDDKGTPLTVAHLHFHQWKENEFPNASWILTLLSEAQRYQSTLGSPLITVHCSDGSGRTGTFCTIVSSIERVKLETSVDFVLDIRSLQAQRPEMVNNETQYVVCHDIISSFIRSFDEQLYDNFKSSDTGTYPSTSVNGNNYMVTKC